MGNEAVAPHAGRSGAGVQATVRSTREEPRKSPSVCTAPSRAGETRAPRRSPSPPRPLQLLSGRKSWGAPHWTPRLRGQSTDSRGGPSGQWVRRHKPGGPRLRDGSGNAGGSGSQPPGRPGGRPPPLPCPTPAGSAGRPPPALLGARPGPRPVTSAPQPPCSRRRRGSDLPLSRPSPRIARRALALSRDLGGTGREAPGRRSDGGRGLSLRPAPGMPRLGERSEPKAGPRDYLGAPVRRRPGFHWTAVSQSCVEEHRPRWPPGAKLSCSPD